MEYIFINGLHKKVDNNSNLNCIIITSILRFSLIINTLIFSQNLCFDVVFNDMDSELFFPIEITLIAVSICRQISNNFSIFPNFIRLCSKKKVCFVGMKSRWMEKEGENYFFFFWFFLNWLKAKGLGGPEIFYPGPPKSNLS